MPCPLMTFRIHALNWKTVACLMFLKHHMVYTVEGLTILHVVVRTQDINFDHVKLAKIFIL